MNKQWVKALAWGAGAVWALSRMKRRYNLTGKVVAISGGSRGLGLDLAQAFAARGARVAICGRDPQTLRRAELLLAQRGITVLATPCDVTDPVRLKGWLEEVETRMGAVDVLVNNAGVISVGPFEETTVGDYREGMDTHFWAPLHAVRTVAPGMVRRRQGRIVNIASIGGLVGIPHFLPYVSSKFALVGFSRALTAELARHGVGVTTICPGLMRTGSALHAKFKGQHRKEFAFFSAGAVTPLSAMASERAAEQIVEACARGDREVVLSIQAQLLARAQALMPNAVITAMGWVNRLLPRPGGVGTRRVEGRDSQSGLSRIWMATLNRPTALRHNQEAQGA